MFDDIEGSRANASSGRFSAPSVEQRLAQLERHYAYVNEHLQNARRHNLVLGAEVERLTKELEAARGPEFRGRVRRALRFVRRVLDFGVRVGRRVAIWAYRVLPE